MSRSLILVSLLLCMCGVASAASNGYLILTSYTDSKCSAGATVVSNTGYTFGSCSTGSSNAVYIVTDGAGTSVVSEVGFVDATTCNTAYYAQQSYQFGGVNLNACTASGGLYQQYSLKNTGSPAVPALTASGTGTLTGVTYYDPVTYAQNTICPIPSTAITLPSSAVTGVCLPQSTTTSYLNFCVGGNQFQGTATFNVAYTAATACSAASFVSASLSETAPLNPTCYQGQPVQCFGGAAPSYIPNQGIISYSQNDPCTNADGLATVQLFAQATCVANGGGSSAFQFSCGTNSTTGASQVTYAQYSSATCLPNTQTSVTQGLASTVNGKTAATATNLAGTVGCRSSGPGSNIALTCAFYGSASSISFSVFALLFAAVASLIAAKSL